MTGLHTARLHNWLTDQIDALKPTDNDPRNDGHIVSDFDIFMALRDVDGWLRNTAVAQLHQPGHDLNPPALLATGRVEADLDQLRTWITGRAEHTPIEERAKTYQAVANQLHRFAIAPDPFPHGDDTPGWAAPVPRTWPRRLVLAYRAARDLVR